MEPKHASDQGFYAFTNVLKGVRELSALLEACLGNVVDLTGTYSNRVDLAELLRHTRRWVSEDHQGAAQDLQLSVRAKPAAVVPRRVVDRLGVDVVRDIVEARRAGTKLRVVAEQYGVSESTVKRLLRASSRRPVAP